ncbi:MAG: hypothetical protein IPJ77_07755 [Planctomycetes bacterium]|nr:hypothetical protein [Planctomycetota bacterium]
MRRGAPPHPDARLAIALVLASMAACVSPKHPEPPPNERDPADARNDCRVRGAGGFLNGLAGYAAAKS